MEKRIEENGKKLWKRIGAGFLAAAIAVSNFATAIPALTLEENAYCGYEEHVHYGSCYETQLVCAQDDTVLHQHTEQCVEQELVLTCTLPEQEGHSHSEACLDDLGELVCGKDEAEGHAHTEGCYEQRDSYVCGLEEGKPAHTHGESCYAQRLVCGKEEHFHSLQCYSNLNADIETASVWENSVSSAERTGSYGGNLAAVARTQVGYKESAENYIVDEEGNKQGYSRYGAWYGEPYSPWDTLFVAFCLNYAQIPESVFPRAQGCEELIEKLQSCDLFRTVGSYVPGEGDIVFLQEGEGSRAGIVEEVRFGSDGTAESIAVIFGNAAGEVVRKEYVAGDYSVTGFGAMPAEEAEELTEAVTEETVESVPTEVSEAETTVPETVEEETEPETETETDATLWVDDGYDGLYSEDELAQLPEDHAFATASVEEVQIGFGARILRFAAELLGFTSKDEGELSYNWTFDAYYVRQEDANHVEKTDNFQLKYQMKFHTDFDIRAGEAEIRIPAALYSDRNGNPVNFAEIGIPLVSGPDSCQPARTSPFNCYLDSATNELVFFNYKDITAGTNAIWQVHYESIDIMMLVDESEWSVDAVARVIHPDGSELTSTKTLSGHINNGVTLNALTKIPYQMPGKTNYTPGLYTARQVSHFSGVPEEEVDLDNYIYVVWEVEASFGYRQAWELYLKDTTWMEVETDEGTHNIPGEVVGYNRNGATYCDGALESGNYAGYYKVDEQISGTGTSNSGRTIHIVTRYPAAEFVENHTTTKNEAEVILHPYDGKDPDQEKKADAQWAYKNFSWDYPDYIIGVRKGPKDSDYDAFSYVYPRVSDLRQDGMPGEDYGKLHYYTRGTLRGSFLTRSYVSPTIGQYRKNSWTELTTVDDYLLATVESGACTGEVKELTKEDYYFSSVRIVQTDSSYDFFEDEELKHSTDDEFSDNGEKLDRSLYIYAMFAGNEGEGREDGEWEFVAQVPWNDSGVVTYSFTAEDIAKMPYRVKAVHKSMDNTYCDIDVDVTLRSGSPIFNDWYGKGAETIRVENISGVMGCMPERSDVTPVGGEHRDGLVWIQDQTVDDTQYTEQEPVDLIGFTRGLYHGMLLMRDCGFADLLPLGMSATAKKTAAISNSVENGRYELTYTLSAEEGYKISSRNDIAVLEEVGLVTLEDRKSVEFYDLLPENVQFDASKPVTAMRLSARNDYSSTQVSVGNVEIINNWRGTHRTLLVFTVTYEGSDPSIIVDSSGWFTGYQIRFGAYCCWEDSDSLAERNIAAYMPSAQDRNPIVGQENQVARDDGVIVPQSLAEICAPFTVGGGDLNGDGETGIRNVLYMENKAEQDFPASSNSQITKEVKAHSDEVGAYGPSAVVNPEGYYDYRITVQNMDNIELKELVVFDRLENSNVDRVVEEPNRTFDKDIWYGVLAEDPDLWQAEAIGIKPVVYYSAERNALIPEQNSDVYPWTILTTDNGWYKSEDFLSEHALADVKAIAVDLSKKASGEPSVLGGDEGNPVSVSFTLTMQAPKLPEDPAVTHTYNNPGFSSLKGVRSCVIGDSVVVTMVEDGSFTLKKTVDEAAPAVQKTESFEFRITDGDNIPYGDKLYRLYEAGEDASNPEKGTLLGTDAQGRLSLKDGQTAVFWGAAAAKLQAEEINTGIYWNAVPEYDSDTNTVTVYNEWRPLLYMQKKLSGLPRYESESDYKDTAFYFRVEKKVGNVWTAMANEPVYFVARVVTGTGTEPVIRETGSTNDLGIVKIKLNDIIAVSPGRVGTEYRIVEVSDENGTVKPEGGVFSAGGWTSMDAERTGTLAVSGNSETIVNQKQWKTVYLTKKLDKQNPEDCGRKFSFVLCENGVPAKGIAWYSYATAEDVRADHFEEDGFGVTGEDGILTVPAGTIVKLTDLKPDVAYTLSEKDPGEEYILRRYTCDRSYESLDAQAAGEDCVGGVRFTIDIGKPDIGVSFTNEYRMRDLKVTKQLLSDTRTDKVFTMTLEKKTGEDTYEAAAGKDFEIRNSLGSVLWDKCGKTDENGQFGLCAGETAIFSNLDLVGTEYRVIETEDDSFIQLVPRDNGALELPIGENGAEGTIINGDDSMLLLQKKWNGQDEEAQRWLESDSAVLGVYLKVEQLNENQEWVPAEQCTYLVLAEDNSLTTGEIKDGTIFFADPAHTTLILTGKSDAWMSSRLRITETAIEAASDKNPLTGSIIAKDQDGNPVLVELSTEVAEYEASVTEDKIVVLENRAESQGMVWVKKYVTGLTDPSDKDVLTWRLEKYVAGQWIPADGVKYIVSYDCDNVAGGEACYTDLNGLLQVKRNPVEPAEGETAPAYLAAVGFTVPVKVGPVNNPADGTYRVVEVEEQTDDGWGKLVAYADENGHFHLVEGNEDGTDVNTDIVVAEPTGFVNSNDEKVIRIEKRMDDGKTEVGPFVFEMRKIVNGQALPGQNLPYEIYRTEDNEKLSEGTIGADGRFSLMSGQYALITIPSFVKWIINELPDFPYVLSDVEIRNGDGTPTDTGVEIVPKGYMLRSGAEINAMLPADVKNVVFDYSGRYNPEELEEIGNADEKDQGSIKMYRQGTTVLILSDGPVLANPDCSEMFRSCGNLAQVRMDNLELCSAVNMDSMFQNCSGLTANPLANKDTHNAASMSAMFAGCGSLTSFSFSSMDLSSLQNASAMLANCGSLRSVDFSGTNAEQITNMQGMLAGCTELESVSIADLDTSHVRNIQYLFSGCTALKELDLRSMDTSAVRKADGVFSGCSALEKIHGTDWTGNEAVASAYSVFTNCDSLKGSIPFNVVRTGGAYCTPAGGYFVGQGPEPENALLYTPEEINKVLKEASSVYDFDSKVVSVTFDLATGQTKSTDEGTPLDRLGHIRLYRKPAAEKGKYDVSILADDPSNWLLFTSTSYLFRGMSGLSSVTFNSFNTGNVTNMNNMFSECSSLTALDVSGFDTGNVTNMGSMFSGCSSLTELNLFGSNTGNVTNMGSMFSGCSSLTTLGLSGWNTGNVTYMYSMFYKCSSLTTLDVSGFDTGNVTDMRHMFSDCSSLTALDVSGFDTGNVTSMYCMFTDCSSLTELNLFGSNTGNVTNMGFMFYGCSSLTTLGLSGWNTGNVTNMSCMFNHCRSLTTLGLSGWNTGNVTDMGSMFFSCSSLTALDVSGFDTGNVTDMNNMFSGCSSLTTLGLSGWDTNNVTNMKSMFSGCSSLTTLDVSGWNTNIETSMRQMFYKCSSLKTICAYDWTVSGYSTDVFYGCSALSSKTPGGLTAYDSGKTSSDYCKTVGGYFTLPATPPKNRILYQGDAFNSLLKQQTGVTAVIFDLRENNTEIAADDYWRMALDRQGKINLYVVGDTAYILADNKDDWKLFTTAKSMFQRNYWLESVKFISFEASNITNADRMFSNCSSLTELNLSGWETGNVSNMVSMFYNCSSLTELDLSGFDTGNVTDMNSMFNGCSSLTELNLFGWNTGNVTDMRFMFNGCSSLTALDVSGWNTGNVTDMGSMFSDCSSLTVLDVSGWDTNNVKYMSSMFSDCSSLTTLDVSGFDTGNVTDMGYMFSNCSSLTALDVSNFDTGKVINMGDMFSGCSGLTELNVTGFDTSEVTDMCYMFSGCSSLTELDLPRWDTSKVTSRDGYGWSIPGGTGMFMDCSSLKRIYANDLSQTVSMGNLFSGCTSLTGQPGLGLEKYDEEKTSGEYARVVGGYFSLKDEEAAAALLALQAANGGESLPDSLAG